jgi:hypothetical protein
VALGPGNPATKGGQATIGIRSASALTSGGQIPWSFQAPVVDDETALLFSSGEDAPPVTMATVSGPVGSNGWFKGAVRVTLTAADGGGPIAATRYAIDGGADVLYSAPFAVSGDGIHSVSYFSIDGAGNSEMPKALSLKIDGTAPAASASASPSSLWPANGRTVPVVVSGAMSDATSGLDPSSALFSVTDEQGDVQPSGRVSVSSTGRYSFTVPLVASRKGQDADGRAYTVVVRVQDKAGNMGQVTTVVTVPHDRGTE